MLRDGIILPSGEQYNAIQRKKSVGYLVARKPLGCLFLLKKLGI